MTPQQISAPTGDPQAEFLRSIGGQITPTFVAGLENFIKDQRVATSEIKEQVKSEMKAFSGNAGWTGWNRVFWRPFDGEKTMGGMGPINRYWLDHDALRMRSWQLMLESEIVQIGIQRYVMWLIGQGLKLKCEPDTFILKKNGINLDSQAFSKEAEAYWSLYAHNEISDSAGMETLHCKMYEAEINALAGGDCLFIINLDENNLPVVDLKDGAHVRTPLLGATAGIEPRNPNNGNRIRNGIEVDEKGQHVAFWIRKGTNNPNSITDMTNYERIVARDKTTGYIRAFMYYGLRYRRDDIRGIPLISVCMETTKQLELYKEATVTGAVERAKIAIVMQHEVAAKGGNPFDSILMNAAGGPYSDVPADSNGTAFQNIVAGTTSKQVINPEPGTKIVALEGKQEIHFGEFYDTNLTVIFAALGIPKEIALMLFGSNYSASRASIKDWEHTLIVKRVKNVSPAYRHIYDMFLLTQVLAGTINAPGYIEAVMNKETWVRLAYQKAKWVGDNPPNIDEKKEVEAARLKAGAGSSHLPLDTMENIANDLGLHGDYQHTLEEYQNVMKEADKLGIEKVEPARTTIEQFGEPGEDKPGKPGNKPVKTQDTETDPQTVPDKKKKTK